MRNLDRISRLPDEILHRIISSLPVTREAVRTSILSKRWRYLYLSVSSLRLYRYDFIKKDSKRKRSRLQREEAESLRLFLGRMLPHLDSSTIQMQTLSPLFARCLLVAAKRSIQHLDLSCFPVKIPPCVFAFQSLVTLSLVSCKIDVEDLNNGCLLRLPTLKLFHMWFGMSSAAKLISGCPALRHLTMTYCVVDGDLDISSHALQTLTLICTDLSGDLSVSASALLSFIVNLREARGCTLRGLSSLVILSIEAWPAIHCPLDILEALHNVQELKLGFYVIEILFDKIIALGQLPTFSRLKKLELNTYLGSGPIQEITCILQCFPSLEELVIRRCEGYRSYRKSIVPSEPSEEFLGNLKLLKLDRYPCVKNEKKNTSLHKLFAC